MQTNALLSLQLSTLFLFNWILHPEFAFGLRLSTLAGVVASILDAVSYINLVRRAGIEALPHYAVQNFPFSGFFPPLSDQDGDLIQTFDTRFI